MSIDSKDSLSLYFIGAMPISDIIGKTLSVLQYLALTACKCYFWPEICIKYYYDPLRDSYACQDKTQGFYFAATIILSIFQLKFSWKSFRQNLKLF